MCIRDCQAQMFQKEEIQTLPYLFIFNKLADEKAHAGPEQFKSMTSYVPPVNRGMVVSELSHLLSQSGSPERKLPARHIGDGRAAWMAFRQTDVALAASSQEDEMAHVST